MAVLPGVRRRAVPQAGERRLPGRAASRITTAGQEACPTLARDPVLLDLLVQRGAVDAENGGGLLDVAAGALNGRGDHDLLHLLQARARRERPRLARRG